MKVKNRETGVVFAASPRLVKMAAKRKDLEIIDDGQPLSAADEQELKRIDAQEAAAEQAIRETGGNPGNPDDSSGSADQVKDSHEAVERQIKSLKGKNQLEELMRENYGVDLDKRKTLGNMKEDAMRVIAEAKKG